MRLHCFIRGSLGRSKENQEVGVHAIEDVGVDFPAPRSPSSQALSATVENPEEADEAKSEQHIIHQRHRVTDTM